ncbi:HU family DNA-binding protein [Corynebacterium hansenii]|uniref:DNA-binding protein HupB n=1 Tax=Corynebacterium hansenii TaxID=394964 RepID=A0ABV7ZUN0_9CORY|nr:HU family DNA-binding protein [Corynebacterium hansenii]WJY99682.1 DNA-binding protein HU [Corynebacterium hansenii]
MNKADLVAQLAEKLDINHADAAAAVEGTLDIVVRSVAQGKSVTIMGFGTLESRERAPRTARNPHTGETIEVPATRSPAFRPGNYFRAVVKEGRADDEGISVRRSSSHTGFDA